MIRVVWIEVKCPNCGKTFSLNLDIPSQPKGVGAHYARKIKKLSPLHRQILEILKKYGELPKWRIGRILFEEYGRRVSGNSLSGRLSELLGMGLVSCKRTEVRVYDKKQQKYRFVKKPVWSIRRDVG